MLTLIQCKLDANARASARSSGRSSSTPARSGAWSTTILNRAHCLTPYAGWLITRGVPHEPTWTHPTRGILALVCNWNLLRPLICGYRTQSYVSEVLMNESLTIAARTHRLPTDVADRARRLVEAGTAANTRRAYQNDLRYFWTWASVTVGLRTPSYPVAAALAVAVHHRSSRGPSSGI